MGLLVQDSEKERTVGPGWRGGGEGGGAAQRQEACGQRARPGPGSQPALLTLRGCSGRDAPFLPFIAYPLESRHRAGSLLCTPPLALLTNPPGRYCYSQFYRLEKRLREPKRLIQSGENQVWDPGWLSPKPIGCSLRAVSCYLSVRLFAEGLLGVWHIPHVISSLIFAAALQDICSYLPFTDWKTAQRK